MMTPQQGEKVMPPAKRGNGCIPPHLEEDGGGRDLLGVGLVAVAEVAAVGQVQRHDALVRQDEGRVDREVGGRARKGLHVDPPLGRVQPKGLQGAVLQQRGVGELVAMIKHGLGFAASPVAQVREDNL